MTIIMAMGNRENFYLISDRRLSYKSTVVDEFYNKATTLNLKNARFGIGFTGIATASTHSTQESILEIAYEILKNDNNFYNFPKTFSTRLTDLFKTDPILTKLSRSQKRLSILLGGYLTDANPPALATAIISNFQDFQNNIDHTEASDEFHIIYEQEKRDPRPKNPTLIQRVGAYNFFKDSDMKSAREALLNNFTQKKIEEMMTGIVRRMSDESKHLIGKDVSFIIIPSDLTKQPGSKIHYYNKQSSIQAPDAIFYDSKKDSVVSIKGLQISTGSAKNTEKIFPPKLGRNDRCYCGSGLKYKKCHGK